MDPRTPDLGGQLYRVSLFGRAGFQVWDGNWYAGHDLPGYSLLFPPLGSLLGARAAAAICAPLSTALLGALLARDYGRGAPWGAGAFALAAVGDLWLGRLAFALGVTFALGAALAYRRGHPLGAAALAALSAAGSPVAGLCLGLAGLTLSLHRRSPRAVLALGLPPALVVLPLAALFPEGGAEPYPLLSFLATAGATCAFLLAVPRRERLLRLGAVVYLAACLLFLAVHSPVGSNIERYGILLGAPLLLCAMLREASPGARGAARAIGAAGALALAAIGLWVLWGPVRETEAVAGSPATEASYYRPLLGYLAAAGGPQRVEIPLTRSHWEAYLAAIQIPLARGWEKQLDERYDGALLGGRLTPRSYRRWLDREAVSLVALPDVPLDPSSAAEGRLIRAGLPYLRLVDATAHWRIYRVLGATPLAAGPGRMASLGHDGFTLDAQRRGSFLVRVRYTPYFAVTAGAGCVEAAGEGFTEVRAERAGPLAVAARFSLGAALGGGRSCRTRRAAQAASAPGQRGSSP